MSSKQHLADVIARVHALYERRGWGDATVCRPVTGRCIVSPVVRETFVRAGA